MSTTTVHTQAEYDAAFEKHKDDWNATIIIDAPRGVWIAVPASGSATVEAYDSATVRASGSATVEAYDSATVEASGSATVEASRFVAVHLWSQRVTLSGGVVIDLTALDSKNLGDWCDYTGTERDGDTITVYKAVDDNLKSGQGFAYPIGGAVEDSRWRDDHDCGGGLHFSPTPTRARSYFWSATRFLECTVNATEARTIGWDKLKAPRATVIREVTIDGEPVAS